MDNMYKVFNLHLMNVILPVLPVRVNANPKFPKDSVVRVCQVSIKEGSIG